MKLTRRGVVASGLAALVGTAGCLGGGSNVRYPADSGPSAADGDEPLVGGSATPASHGGEDDSVSESVPNAPLARNTRRIVSELAWFGGEYEAAIADYREGLAAVEREVRALRELDSLGTAELEELDDLVVRARTVAERTLGEHFLVAGVVDSVGSNHVRIVEKFTRRDDHDRVDVELQRLANFFNGLRSRPYIDRHLSANPIQNRLLDWLRGGAPPEDEPSLFSVYHGPTRFQSVAYRGDHVVFDRAPFPGVSAGVPEGPFAGLATPEERLGVTVVNTFEPPARDDWVESEDDDDDDDDDNGDDDEDTPEPPQLVDRRRFPVDGIHVQQYRDAAAASDALDSLLDGDVVQEGSRSLDGREWRRVYYPHDGDVMYAFVVQAGEFLLSVAASETAWEERVGWRGPLRRSWVL